MGESSGSWVDERLFDTAGFVGGATLRGGTCGTAEDEVVLVIRPLRVRCGVLSGERVAEASLFTGTERSEMELKKRLHSELLRISSIVLTSALVVASPPRSF